MIDGVKYSEIIKAYPDLNLRGATLTGHHRHFVAGALVDDSKENTDHDLVDELRDLALYIIRRAREAGYAVTLIETRIFETAIKGIGIRTKIADAQVEQKAWNALLANASKAVWEHADGDVEDV